MTSPVTFMPDLWEQWTQGTPYLHPVTNKCTGMRYITIGQNEQKLAVPIREAISNSTDDIKGLLLLSPQYEVERTIPDELPSKMLFCDFSADCKDGCPVILCTAPADAVTLQSFVGSFARVLCPIPPYELPGLANCIIDNNQELWIGCAAKSGSQGSEYLKTMMSDDNKRYKQIKRHLHILDLRPPLVGSTQAASDVVNFNSQSERILHSLFYTPERVRGWHDIATDQGYLQANKLFETKLIVEMGIKGWSHLVENYTYSEPDTLAEISSQQQDTEYHWIVDSLLPSTGLSILAGASGSGKSFLALRLAIESCCGGVFLGRPVKPCDVLLLSLEDSLPMLLHRLRGPLAITQDDLMRMKRLQIVAIGDISRGVNIADEGLLHLDLLGLDYITCWIANHSTAERRLIIIDVLQEILQSHRSGGRDAYQQAYQDLSPLKRLASRNNTAILLIHHMSNKKFTYNNENQDVFDKMVGSTAYKSVPHARWALVGSIKQGSAKLIKSIKEADDREDIPLVWREPGGWDLASEAEAKELDYQWSHAQLSATEIKVLDAIRENPGCNNMMLHELTNVSYDMIRRITPRLRRLGQVECEGSGTTLQLYANRDPGLTKSIGI